LLGPHFSARNFLRPLGAGPEPQEIQP
jgi:hypothetical protein